MNTLFRPLAVLLVLASLCTGLLAQEAVIRKNLPKRVPQIQTIDEIRKSPIGGLYEVRFNGSQLLYTDAKADYLIDGKLFDTKERRNLTDERLDELTALKFDQLPLKDAFTIVRGNGERKLAVFEDPNCGYCKRFEKDLQKIDNVTVYMFLIPILGQDSVEKSRAIWCAKDRAQAWQDWMVRDQPMPTTTPMCDTSGLQRNLALARNYRISGTPTLFFADNVRVPGAISAAEVEKRLADAR